MGCVEVIRTGNNTSHCDLQPILYGIEMLREKKSAWKEFHAICNHVSFDLGHQIVLYTVLYLRYDNDSDCIPSIYKHKLPMKYVNGHKKVTENL